MNIDQSIPAENQQEAASQQPAAPQRSYNPFIDVVNEKPYTQMNVNVGQQQMASPIPEPSIQSNTVSSNENAYNMLNNDFGAMGGGGAKSSGSTVNPSMNSLPDADKKLGAEHMAKLIVDGYEQLHQFANKGLQISERKLRKMVTEGEIDLSVQIPYDYGKTISAGEFVQDFNEQNKDTLTVTKEFKKEVTPVLTRVLAKRGAGVTDEQYLMYLFGKDILVKGVIFTQIRGTMNDMLGVIKEYTAAVKETGQAPASAAPQPEKPRATPPPPPPTPPAQPTYSSSPEPVTPFDSDDFNFRTNEVVMDSTVQRHAVPESGKARLMAQRKRDREIEQAMKRAASGDSGNRSAYTDALSKKKTGKRGRKPKDYIKQIDESQIADAIILSETKNSD